ncbi:hypothetical protein NHQ30_003820 [Ciborinia camelliae]|nr:hypothetical protein NHQ30_003820 [Ciborinia camelliae]
MSQRYKPFEDISGIERLRAECSDEISSFKGVHIPGRSPDSCFDVHCLKGVDDIVSITHSVSDSSTLDNPPSDNGDQHNYRLIVPGLCHPHIHLDKCFLLSHPRYADLEIKEGDFSEAMKLTSEAKLRFEHDDLMDRGRALIEESIRFGVTHMRAFVEVDVGVGMKCLDAGLALKKEFYDKCRIQICVFAQDPIFSHANGSQSMIDLLEQAINQPGVEVIGTTPYVEESLALQEENIQWAIETAKLYELHLDFHLDYNLDADQKPAVHSVIERLHRAQWPTYGGYKDLSFRTVVLGHCTRLTLFDDNAWQNLRREIGDLPVSFVGLPTSDLFMMGRPDKATGGSSRVRGTLQVIEMINKYDFNAAIGINNVGNAFTPYGNCDPMSLTSLGVGIYQAGTKEDAEILLACVSTRARAAIGLDIKRHVEIDFGSPANFVIFGTNGPQNFRARKSIQELVCDAGVERTTIFEGREMHDPFPIPPSQWLSQAVQPFADYFHLTTLPLHIHEVLGSFLAYTFINKVVAPQVSVRLFPEKYSKFTAKQKLNWDVHVVSLCQSSLINALALWVMFVDEERKNMTAQERVHGYTGASGMIQGLATGYFLWDLMITLQNLRVFGIGMLAHATSALLVFSFGFRPFVNFYGCTFILYELSSPFLNFHWFFDKLDMTGSKPQLYNGIALLFTFFCCRLVWGTYQSIRVYQDVWKSLHNQPSSSASINIDALTNGTASALNAAAGHSAAPVQNDIMRFAAADEFIPLWLGFTYLGSNLVLNTLNFYWFGKMIEAVRKRFQPAKEGRQKDKAIATKSTGANGKTKIGVEQNEVRRRKALDDDDEPIAAVS